MLAFHLLSVSLGLLSVIAAPDPRPRKCGTTISDSELQAAEKHFRANAIAATSLRLRMAKSMLPKPLNVYWHAISSNETRRGGAISDETIAASIEVLNNAYKSTGVTFTLVQTTRTLNHTWFTEVSQDNTWQTDMKKTLRVGNSSDLNIYSVGFDSTGLLGYATFPQRYQDEPHNDGVVISPATLPGGWEPSFNLGHTLTHEVGHWFGLHHTFQGGCSGGGGDQVDDTPPEAYASSGCPIGRDTCDGDTLPDPIHNFMDYSNDECMREFTPGQGKRIRSQLRTYRGLDLPEDDRVAPDAS
ncbi:hypothetical protein HGRIS_002588 [Hohenbuehelia grisea]|uniref:Peptidase M43 pregnancy-associated plasma-A domain-containing protein n=1 Tax=Hohenbuehelia grisea TaxID=104357 RepID=A0ABR3JMU4_9AGAR